MPVGELEKRVSAAAYGVREPEAVLEVLVALPTCW